MATALPTLPAPSRAQRDDEFYCRDVIFLVEDVLFKVSRRPFEEDSEAFAGMFQLPPTDNPSRVEGTSDDNPIHLPVTQDEFRALLYVLFPTTHTTRSLTKETWMSALRLADMWGFDGVREKAIIELRRLIPGNAERVRIARLYNIPGWVEPALKELALQDTLSAADLEALGWGTAARLMQVRESVQFSGNCACACNYCSITHGVVGPPHVGGTRTGVVTAASVRRGTDFSARIREVFADDLF